MVSIAKNEPVSNTPDLAALEAMLQEQRRAAGIVTPGYADMVAENERLLKSEAERNAQRAGLLAQSQRRANDQTERHAIRPDPLPCPPPQKPPEAALFDKNLYIWTDINAALIQRGKANGAKSGDLIKAHARTHNGQSWYTSADFQAVLVAGGMHPRNALRAMRDSIGIQWDTYQDKRDRRVVRYHILQPAEVARRLGLKAPGHEVRLPLTAYQGNTAHYKAHVLDGWREARDTSARSVQVDTFGHSKRTLQVWSKRVKGIEGPREAEAPRAENERQADELEGLLQRADGTTRHCWTDCKGRVYYQLTNLYHSTVCRHFGTRRAVSIIERIKEHVAPNEVRKQDPVTTVLVTFDNADRAERYQQRHTSTPIAVLEEEPGRIPRLVRTPARHIQHVETQRYTVRFSLDSAVL